VLLNNFANMAVPNINRMPAVTNTNRKMITICWLERPFNNSCGVITPGRSKATVQMKKVNAGLNNSLYRAYTKNMTTPSVYNCTMLKSTNPVEYFGQR